MSRVGVEASCLLASRRTGVGNYVASLLREMVALRTEAEFLLVHAGPPADMGRLGVPGANVRTAPLGIPRRVSTVLQRYGVHPPLDLVARASADVYLFPNFVTWPLSSTRAAAVVVHDLAYRHVPDTCTRRMRSLLEHAVPEALARCGSVVTVSQFTRHALVQEYGVDAGRIAVAPPGVDRTRFRPTGPAERASLLNRHRLRDGGYVLFVGTVEPRKNLLGLLDAYTRLPPALTARFPLVLAGATGALDGGIRRRLQQLDRTGSVRSLGYVAAADLPLLYGGAAVFAYPSLYEGYGMPVVEAMACGAPVVTSSTSSLPEAAGDAALLVDPTCIPELTAALERVLSDGELRSGLVSAGPRRAGLTDWRTSATIVLDVLDALLAAAPPRGQLPRRRPRRGGHPE